MYFFIFRAGDGIYFECPLDCRRCPQLTKYGTRCRLRSCIGNDMCWIHLLSQRHLRIKESGAGRGKGLFALDRAARGRNEVIFRRGELIVEYEGEILTEAEVDRRYGPDNTAPYTVDSPIQDRYWDAACSRSAASMTNHAAGRRTNAKFVFNDDTEMVEIRATKNIYNDTEIFVNYGRNYILNQDGIESTTKQRRR